MLHSLCHSHRLQAIPLLAISLLSKAHLHMKFVVELKLGTLSIRDQKVLAQS